MKKTHYYRKWYYFLTLLVLFTVRANASCLEKLDDELLAPVKIALNFKTAGEKILTTGSIALSSSFAPAPFVLMSATGMILAGNLTELSLKEKQELVNIESLFLEVEAGDGPALREFIKRVRNLSQIPLEKLNDQRMIDFLRKSNDEELFCPTVADGRINYFTTHTILVTTIQTFIQEEHQSL